MLITPLQFLLVMLALTAAGGALQWSNRRRRTGVLRRLAEARAMHFSADDRFRLTPRIASLLPVPGAASVRVGDLVYGIDGENYRYVFSTEYTTGVLRTKTSVRRVASYCEPRDPAAAAAARKLRCELAFAPESLPLAEQYEHLLGATGKVS